eukprot:6271905-Heterocapsa_arctica.AAC.1
MIGEISEGLMIRWWLGGRMPSETSSAKAVCLTPFKARPAHSFEAGFDSFPIGANRNEFKKIVFGRSEQMPE